MEDIRETELREAADFQVRSADLPGEDGALPEVAFSVWQPQGPRLDGPQVHLYFAMTGAAARSVTVSRWALTRAQKFSPAAT